MKDTWRLLTVLSRLLLILLQSCNPPTFEINNCHRIQSFLSPLIYFFPCHLWFISCCLSTRALPQSSSRGQVWAAVGCSQHSIAVLSLLCPSPLFHSLESFCWITYFAWPKLLSEAGWQMLLYFTVAHYYRWKITNFTSSYACFSFI